MKHLLAAIIAIFPFICIAQTDEEIISGVQNDEYSIIIEHKLSADSAFLMARDVILSIYEDYSSKIELEDRETNKLVCTARVSMPRETYKIGFKVKETPVFHFTLTIDNKERRSRLKFSHMGVLYTDVKILLGKADEGADLEMVDYLNPKEHYINFRINEAKNSKLLNDKRWTKKGAHA